MAIDSLDAGLSEDELDLASSQARAEFLEMRDEVKASGGGTASWYTALFRKMFVVAFHTKRHASWARTKIAALEKELAELRQAFAEVATGNLADQHRGVWREGEQYKRGELVTHGGGLWLVLRHTTDRPGTGDAMRLVVKRGGKA